MSITLVGGLALVAAVAVFLWNAKTTWALVVLTLPLQATAAIVWRQDGVGLSYFLMLVACSSTALWLLSQPHHHYLETPSCLAKTWGSIAVVTGWVCLGAIGIPHVLGGRLVVNSYVSGMAVLRPTSSNYIHAGYMVLCAVSSFFLSNALSKDDGTMDSILHTVYILSFAVSVGFMLWHYLHFYLGIYYPAGIIYNNPSIAQNQWGGGLAQYGVSTVRRISGSFSEPSYAGMYYVSWLGFFLSQAVDAADTRVPAVVGLLISLAALATAGSTTGFVAATGLVALLVISRATSSRKFADGRPNSVWHILILLAIIIISIAIVFPQAASAVWQVIWLASSRKIQRSIASGYRIDVEAMAIQVFFKSWGLGAGAGSNASLTLPGYVLSNLGLLGVLAIAAMVVQIWKLYHRALEASQSLGKETSFLHSLAWALIGQTLAGVVGVPVIYSPILWINLAVLVGISASRLREQQASGNKFDSLPNTHSCPQAGLSGQADRRHKMLPVEFYAHHRNANHIQCSWNACWVRKHRGFSHGQAREAGMGKN